MPTYEYECTECGYFSRSVKMAEYRNAQPCPVCGRDAERVILSVPALATLAPQTRNAIATNERSAHAPRESKRTHGSGCACCAGTSVNVGANGTKAFPEKRPWMISH